MRRIFQQGFLHNCYEILFYPHLQASKRIDLCNNTVIPLCSRLAECLLYHEALSDSKLIPSFIVSLYGGWRLLSKLFPGLGLIFCRLAKKQQGHGNSQYHIGQGRNNEYSWLMQHVHSAQSCWLSPTAGEKYLKIYRSSGEIVLPKYALKPQIAMSTVILTQSLAVQ